MITRNLEQLIIPQSNAPQRTTQGGGHNTERPASIANSHKTIVHIVGNLATKNLEVLATTCPYLLQSHTQSWQQTLSVAQQQFSNSSVPPQSTSTHFPSSTTQSVTFWKQPVFLSQSGIGGCQGSNTCAVISLLLAKTYSTNKLLLQLNNHQYWLQAGFLPSCHVWWGKSGIWQFHAVTIISWYCQSHTFCQKQPG